MFLSALEWPEIRQGRTPPTIRSPSPCDCICVQDTRNSVVPASWEIIQANFLFFSKSSTHSRVCVLLSEKKMTLQEVCRKWKSHTWALAYDFRAKAALLKFGSSDENLSILGRQRPRFPATRRSFRWQSTRTPSTPPPTTVWVASNLRQRGRALIRPPLCLHSCLCPPPSPFSRCPPPAERASAAANGGNEPWKCN